EGNDSAALESERAAGRRQARACDACAKGALLLDERVLRAVEAKAGDPRATREELDILAEGPVPAFLLQFLRNPVGDIFEGKLPSVDAAEHFDDMVADLARDRRRADLAFLHLEKRGLESRHGLAAADLAEPAAILRGRTGRVR